MLRSGYPRLLTRARPQAVVQTGAKLAAANLQLDLALVHKVLETKEQVVLAAAMVLKLVGQLLVEMCFLCSINSV